MRQGPFCILVKYDTIRGMGGKNGIVVTFTSTLEVSATELHALFTFSRWIISCDDEFKWADQQEIST